MKVRPALCLDLDGTIRYSKNGEFINGAGDVAVFPDVEKKLWEFRDEGFLVFGISNQGGVAFGHKTTIDVDEELSVTLLAFEKNPFHIVKCCFHHEHGSVEPFNHRSLLRKPDIGMLALCEAEVFEHGYVVDWDRSVFVGDRPEDEELAANARLEFVHANQFFGREP
jgi:D-glycero-D-manno-heptose 1,7-bisphosphate phosphatase